ncbi:MAG: hypothetical protein AAGK78_09560, partial [Planctomycetota bacterium]
MSRPALSIALAAAAASAALALTTPAAVQADLSPRAALNQSLPAITLEATPLDEAINFLQNLTGVTLYVDWGELELAGIDRDTEVTLQLQNISFRRT